MSGIWKKFNPANDLYDQPLAYRGTIAPFGTYTNPDGSESAGFAWPGKGGFSLEAIAAQESGTQKRDIGGGVFCDNGQAFGQVIGER
jgi:hypothetical protein